MDKAKIEISLALVVIIPAEMPERVDPVRVLEIHVDTEDLTKPRTAIVKEFLREASARSCSGLVDEVVGSGETRLRGDKACTLESAHGATFEIRSHRCDSLE